MRANYLEHAGSSASVGALAGDERDAVPQGGVCYSTGTEHSSLGHGSRGHDAAQRVSERCVQQRTRAFLGTLRQHFQNQIPFLYVFIEWILS